MTNQRDDLVLVQTRIPKKYLDLLDEQKQKQNILSRAELIRKLLMDYLDGKHG